MWTTRKNKKGYTFLELIIVLAIIIILLGLGLSSLVSFRNTAALQSTYSTFVEDLKSLQNKARNSSSVNGSTPFIYSIFISKNSYTFGNCNKPPANSSNFFCASDPVLPTVNVNTNNIAFTALNPNCQGIGFVRLPGDVVTIDPILAINASGLYSYNNNLVPNLTKCDYTLTNTVINVSKTISVNLKTGAISLL